MEATVLLSILAGIGVATLNGILSFSTLRRAIGKPTHQYMKIVFRGMGLRALMVLVLVLLCIWLLPLDMLAFALSLIVALVIGLVLEVWVLLRSVKSAQRGDA